MNIIFYIDDDGIGVEIEGKKYQAEKKFCDSVVSRLESEISVELTKKVKRYEDIQNKQRAKYEALKDKIRRAYEVLDSEDD